MKKFLKRTVIGLALLAVLLGFIFLTGLWDGKGQPFFDALMIVVMAFAAYEMIAAVKKAGYNVTVFPICLAVAAIYPMITFFGYTGLWVTMGVSAAVAFGFFVFDSRVTLKDMLMSVFILVYPVMPIGVALTMTSLYGMLPLLVAAAAAMLSDALAYYAGSLIGGKKIFPSISPNKTYAGSITGLLGGAGGAMIVYALFEVAPLPINAAVTFTALFPTTYILFYCLTGTAIAIVSEFGDLFASRIKRELQIKDFSHALGAHGGLIDRLDSIIFAVLLTAIVMEFIV